MASGKLENNKLRPFSIAFSRMIGQQEFDRAIDYLRSGLKGDASDLSSLEMIAHCHHWSGSETEAITACLAALDYDPNSFAMHALLAPLLSEKGEHESAAMHVRRGLENYPEPLPEIPNFILSTFKLLSRFAPKLSDAGPNVALEQIEAEHRAWLDWAKDYLDWYDKTYDDKQSPTEH